MNAQDLELLQSLNRRQLQLETSVSALRTDLDFFARRMESAEPVIPPPLPTPEPITPPLALEIPPPPPPIPAIVAEPIAPPMPPTMPAPSDQEPAVGLEFQFGRWLARIGAVLALITVISFSTVAYEHLHAYIGPWSKLAVLTLVSCGLIAAGFRIERRNADLTVYGRTLAGGGLACLYYTIYGATYVRQLHVIPSALFGSLLLLAWSAGVLYLAERKRSELLSIFAIALAYFSSVITPVGGFTMAANLVLALTAVIFLVRNSWTGLSYLCLAGTYGGYFRQVLDKGGSQTFDSMPFDFRWVTPDFPPSAIYLAGAWVIFTAGIFLARSPHFAEEKRMGFLCLNNGAMVGLLLLASQLSHFGHNGAILGLAGAACLVCFALARLLRDDANDIADAYLIQGLGLVTAGIAIAYRGVTRGLVITIESVFLAAAGAYSRNRIVRVAALLAALLGSVYLVFEITLGDHFSWTLTLVGTVAMLANAWFARYDFWHEPREVSSARFVWSSALCDFLAVGILLAGSLAQPIDERIASSLAVGTLTLTFLVYLVPLFELPALSQVLLVLAQLLAIGITCVSVSPSSAEINLFSAEPQWSQNVVALVTMVLALWWLRQKQVSTRYWLTPLLFVYALAMVGYCYNLVYPRVSHQGWMIDAGLLSLVFLAYGIFARSWPFAIVGQLLLGASVYTFLNEGDSLHPFPWKWWAAAVPPATVYLTTRTARRLLPRLVAHPVACEFLGAATRLYQVIALLLLARWVFGAVPKNEINLTFFALGTPLMLWNLIRPSAFGVRMSFVLSIIGACNYLFAGFDSGPIAFTWANALAFALFVAQPAILRHWGRDLVTEAESWMLVIASSLMAWIFVHNSIAASGSGNLTLGWALVALALIVIGFAGNERRQRWCGLAILAAAIIRVAVHDFWLFSDVYKVLTFFVLTVICLGLSFLYYKFADRLKEWL